MGDGGSHALAVDFFYDERHRAHDGGAHFLHGGHEYARGGRLRYIIHARTHVCGVEAAYGHFIGVGHGQYAHEAVALAAALCLVRSHDVLAEIAVAQHHALGGAGGAGSVDDGGQGIGVRSLGPAVALEGFAVFADELEGFDIHHEGKLFQTLLGNFAQKFWRYVEYLGFGVGEDVLYLVGGGIRKDGDGHAAEGGGGEERHCPVGHVGRKYGYAVAGADAEAGKPLALKVAGVAEGAVGIGLGTVGETAEFAPRIAQGTVFQQLAQGLRVAVPAGCPTVWMSLAHVNVLGICRDVSRSGEVFRNIPEAVQDRLWCHR